MVQRPVLIVAWATTLANFRRMQRLALGLVAASFVFASGCNGAHGRLADSEIDSACRLVERCDGESITLCVLATVDARERADAAGCVEEFAAANRCYVSADVCGVTAGCLTAARELEACSESAREEAMPRALVENASAVDDLDADCRDCPTDYGLTASTECVSHGVSDAQMLCAVDVFHRYEAEAEPVIDCQTAALRALTECLMPLACVEVDCAPAHEARLAACPTLSMEAQTAFAACAH